MKMLNTRSNKTYNLSVLKTKVSILPNWPEAISILKENTITDYMPGFTRVWCSLLKSLPVLSLISSSALSWMWAVYTICQMLTRRTSNPSDMMRNEGRIWHSDRVCRWMCRQKRVGTGPICDWSYTLNLARLFPFVHDSTDQSARAIHLSSSQHC